MKFDINRGIEDLYSKANRYFSDYEIKINKIRNKE